MSDPLLCEHANEVPSMCPCDNDCYCKSHTCKTDDVDNESCPKCGGDLTFGYGLAAGGIGGYVLCMEDDCDYEAKYPDRSVEQPPDPDAVTCLHQVK